MPRDNSSIIKNLFLTGVVVTVSMLAISAFAWCNLPAGAEVPVHWNASGEVDRYASKSEGLLLLPLVSAGLYALLMLIVKIEPRILNLKQSAKAFTAVSVCVGGVLLLSHAIIVAVASGLAINAAAVVAVAVGVLFVVTGNYMGKIRSNFTFGVRTPWTLSSELSWNKTNRLAGKSLMALGLLTLILAFTTNGLFLICACGGLLLAIVAWSCVYSYHVWRNDPESQQA